MRIAYDILFTVDDNRQPIELINGLWRPWELDGSLSTGDAVFLK
jgi:hypothetical protein